jgi:glycosyltransferase involved in cell wall biosynthesis
LVSIVLFVRNRAQTVRRAVESVLNQDYDNIQLVVQDGASTDGTLEILRSFGSRIDLASEPDAGVHDAFWRALRRVKGEIVGTCLSDEQLTPGAITRGVNELLKSPDAGAITGDAYFSDYSGSIFSTWTGQEFDFLAYLLGDYCPHFSATFFRRSALEEVGLFDSPWREGRKEPVEFEIWCRLGTQHSVKYVPHFFYKYGCDAGQLSQSIPRIIEELDRRTAVMDAYLFGKDRFFGENPELRTLIIQRQHEIIVNHLNWNHDPEGARKIEIRMCEVLGRELPPHLRSVRGAVSRHDLTLLKKIVSDAVVRLEKDLVDGMQRGINFLRRFVDRDNWLRRCARALLRRIRGTRVVHTIATPPQASPPPPSTADLLRGRSYVYTAKCFRSRGMLPQALQMYRKAEVLNDPVVDAEACQLALASPDDTDADLELMLRRWSVKETAREPLFVHLVRGRFANFRRKRRITIGYHCIFWNSPGAEAFALSFIAKHQRRDFRIIGYSPFEESSRIQQHFDVFHGATEKYDSETFARLVRSDEVDVFVELSGLSHYNRFRAMALRCAPIQVSYINHLATTQVPNVDYVVGDDIAFPKGSDRYFSEAIYRLPSCLLTYNYDSMNMPPVSPPPKLGNGYTTFGSFGGPYKLNRECIELWAAVLKAVPNSRFIMQNEGMSRQCNIDFIKRQFWKHGVRPDRLIILPGTDRQANLLNYASMDISLDSWPYCGGNSVAEALWQGVPVVTLKGRRAVAAYGASLVSAAGLADMVAETPEEYVDIAAQVAASTERLVDFRRNLRAMMHQHGLADSERMARVLESAFEEMMRRKFGARPEDKALRQADREVSAVNSEASERRRPGLAAAN